MIIKIIKSILLILGVLALLVIAIIIYIAVKKPFGMDVTNIPSTITNITSQKKLESTYDHPLLSESQEVMLESLGVDTENLPTQITQEMQDCAVDALGQERVNAIIGGAAPTVSDILKAKNCL